VPEVAELLDAYDAQLRTRVPERLPEGLTYERDGPILRWHGGGRGFVLYSRPILERLGFTAVTTTTPWVWSPPTA
jgi:hypothetical protein